MSEKNFYLATGYYIKRRYMNDDDEKRKFTHMVSAINEAEAKVLVYCHYDRKCSDYDVSYSVSDLNVHELISGELTQEERERYHYMLS